jgi:DNA modification methylase
VTPTDQFTIEWWPIDRARDYPKNARKWSEQAVDKVASSIKEYGWRQPLVCDADDIIIIGHLRRAAGRKAGMTECPVHVARNLTPEQVRGLRLMDNRSHEEAEWDLKLLAMEMSELRALAVDLNLTGFDENELAKLIGSTGSGDEDAVPEAPPIPVTRRGDMWLLGGSKGHRVLCGDATSVGDVARLMGDEMADLVFTDPPFNVDYEGYTDDKLTMKGDRMSVEDFRCFLEGSFNSFRAAVKAGASVYVCHASSCQREFQNALEAAGFDVRCQIIWAKNTFAWGFGRYKFQHEPIFYCHIVGESDPWYGDKSQSTLWQEAKPAANRVHPTMKPVELVERALRNSSKAGDLVVDFFGGSGSTLIACEKTSRLSRLMELDPKYVDVIVTRWQNFTSKLAIHEELGKTFDELRAARLGEQAPAQEISSATMIES